VSITDDVRAGPQPSGPASDPPPRRDGQFDKTPPQDIAAEQCVLGGMLLSKDAIADVVEILKPGDFYRPVHATIFDAILDLYGRGEPADAITVAAALADSGDLARVGGAPYLHTLIASVPTAANAGYYARIVGERAVLRRLVEAGTRIVQLGYGSAAGGGRDVDDVVDLAQQAVYDVTERRVSEDFAILADMLQPTLDEIEAVGAQGGVMTGVPTGFTDLDRLLNGMHPGQLIIVAGRPGLGKALALDTPLPTPDGWTTMGAVRVGDRLLGADGRPTTVTAVFEVRHDRPCYEVEFSDGSVIVADAEHLWRTSRRGGSGVVTTTVVTTAQIAATLRHPADDGAVYAVDTCRPLAMPERDDLPNPPYDLGVRLGTGPDVTGRIPAEYLRAGEDQRRALLAGLLDAGGSVGPAGEVRYTCASGPLADDVRELVVSLGYRGTVAAGTKRGGQREPAARYTVSFPASDDVFRSEPGRTAHRERRSGGGDAGTRLVVDVRPVASVPVRCVTVDNVDHLYLAGRAMIPTHNSTASMDFARNAAIRHCHASAIFSLEMSKVEIVMRLLSAEARVPLHVLRSGQLSDDDWTKLARCMGEISEAPLFVDDTPNMNLMEIRAKARRLKQRHDLKMIVVDYLQLMSSPKRTESRQQEVAELSRGLKLLAKEVECPVIAVSQLNRGPEQRTDKRPQLSDLRESGCLTAETRVLRADTGSEITMGELFATGARDVPVWALDERLKYVRRHLTHVFSTGEKPVFRMRLASGREIRATANHPFLTCDGWTALGDLSVGDRIAAPRHVTAPEQVTVWDDRQVVLLARLLGDGSVPPRQSMGLFGKRSHEKFVPDEVFALPKRQITLFLRHLWATDGSVWARADGGRGPAGSIYYSSDGRRLIDDVARLLWRYGIQGQIKTVKTGYQLWIRGVADQEAFCRVIGVHGARGDAADQLLEKLRGIRANTNVDTIPKAVWGRIRDILAERGRAHRQFASSMGTQFCGATMWKHNPSQDRIARVAAILKDNELEMLAVNDVAWDEIVGIEPDGVEVVYDATVAGAHNFVANGIAVHNSIEQDADVVILLHRDDYYDKESPRAGEADFIVAKHRNGPTDTVTVAAQLHLSRFVDMAI
jgi:replicative DNA helicase